MQGNDPERRGKRQRLFFKLGMVIQQVETSSNKKYCWRDFIGASSGNSQSCYLSFNFKKRDLDVLKVEQWT